MEKPSYDFRIQILKVDNKKYLVSWKIGDKPNMVYMDNLKDFKQEVIKQLELQVKVLKGL
jgi:hypothetical protein